MNFNPSSYDTLSGQTEGTAERYLKSACHLVNAYFGEGYAKDNPALVGNLVHAMATDFQGMALAKTMTDFTDRIIYALTGN